MNKFLYGALALALTASLHADIVSNQTFIRSRSSLSNNMILGAASKARIAHVKKNALGNRVGVAGYYRASHNTTEIAQNFGGGQAVNNDQDGTLVIEPGQSANFEAEALKLYSGAMDHLATASTTGMSGTVSLSPKRVEYGAHITAEQKLSFLIKGLTLVAEMPIAYVQHSLNPVFTGVANSSNVAGSTLSQYFKGTTFAKTSTAAQQELQYARIDGLYHSKTEVADIKVGAHYWLYSNEKFRVGNTTYVTIPTGSKSTGINLFEPMVGSGHVAFGMKTQVMTNISDIKINAAFDYRYLFKAEQTRTLGIYNQWYNTIATGSQYHNVGLVGGTQAIPAANVLTRKVTVKPGHEFDGLVSASYRYNNFAAALHYNFHAHTAEIVTLSPAARWFDGEYGMLGHAYSVTTPIIVGKNTVTYGGALQQEGNSATIAKDSGGIDNVGSENGIQYSITTAACSGRADVTHKLAATGEWQYREFTYPVTVSAGAEYELPGYKNNTSGIHSWAAWAKLSVCF